jgi:2-(1,2-epoxy-1,2-dihydrophenyl)acetyl-CoA isomerase
MSDERVAAFDAANLYRRGRVYLVELNAPERRNPLNAATIASLHEARKALAARVGGPESARAIILTGAGTAFCSGGDIAAAHAQRSPGADGAPPAADRLNGVTMDNAHDSYFGLRELGCPLIAAVNGPAVGMGIAMALAGDLIIAARSAYFWARFVQLGMGAENGVSWRLPRMVGELRAREMLLLAEKVPAETALAWGLVNRVFDDDGFREQAWAFAARAAEGGPLAVAEVRRLFDGAWNADYRTHLADEHRTAEQLSRTQDSIEAFRAFVEKRPTRFEGR